MVALHPCLPPDLSADVIALEENAPAVGAALTRKIVRFARALHRSGVLVVSGQVMALLQGLEHTGIARRADLYHTARATLLTRRDDLPVFDEVFAAFFGKVLTEFTTEMLDETGEGEGADDQVRRSGENAEASPDPDATDEADQNGHPGDPRLVLATAAGDQEGDQDRSRRTDEEADGVDRTATYSALEVLRRRDFSDLDPDEQRAVQQMMARLGLRMAHRVTRRTRRDLRGQLLDLRQSVRRSLRTGGELITWHRRQRATRPRPLVLLCDVSGSMSIYSHMLVQFLHAARQQLPRVEAFVFSTRLTSITRELRSRQPEVALAAVSEAVHDWSGGTRIGDSLSHFNRHWARRCLGRGAIVLLISDGWDRGNVEQLRREVAHLQRASYRLFWLNPLLGMPGYRPLTRGLLAALPHVDAFLPAHNLQSFDYLGDMLASVRGRRSPQPASGGLPFSISDGEGAGG